MDTIDWSKAPEGATHWEPDSADWFGGWMKLQNGGWFFWGNASNRWVSHGGRISSTRLDAMIPRPAAPTAWDGTGLPPVGTVCEVDYCEEWVLCEIIAHFRQRCGMVAAFTVGIDGEAKALDAFGESAFRPLRTPEQLAAEAREKAVAWMQARFCVSADVAYDMYDAGYRKIEAAE